MLLKLDFESDIPIYQQIRNQVVVGIASGRLVPGEKLPTIRALADEAGINMMTASKAYQLLKQEGYIRTDRRSGAVVCPRPGKAAVPPGTAEGLKLHLCELRLAGMGREEALALCGQLFDEEESV
jgi:DNA-binding transcriptional regulator YhcF (GntR family)